MCYQLDAVVIASVLTMVFSVLLVLAIIDFWRGK